jgi:chemotaxis protein CheD
MTIQNDFSHQFKANNMHFSREFNCVLVKILPGEFYLTRSPIVISTVLGSCVSACLIDRGAGIGGMNHFMLPNNWHDDSLISPYMRYGINAMETLINELIKMGARKEQLEAKIFGGGAVLRNVKESVGLRNTEFVKKYLSEEKIPISAEDMNGTLARKIAFFPATGRVLVRSIRDMFREDILTIERSYAEDLCRKDISGAIEIFTGASKPDTDTALKKSENR